MVKLEIIHFKDFKIKLIKLTIKNYKKEALEALFTNFKTFYHSKIIFKTLVYAAAYLFQLC